MKHLRFLFGLLVVVVLLASCAAPATQTTAPEPTKPPAPTAVPTVVPTVGPTVGGKLVYAWPSEPNTLDPQLSNMTTVSRLVGGTILALDPKTGEYVPYLAKSVETSADGLTWTIKFKEGLKWQDGTAFSAQDYAWTIQRGTTAKSANTRTLLTGFASVTAPDDLTTIITLKSPNSALQYGLTTGFLSPMPKAYVEKVGDAAFARKPIGLGPYMVKDWTTGTSITLERFPDFNWGPAFSHKGAAFISTLEIRFMPEYATRLAALQAGQVDIFAPEARDVETLTASKQYQMLSYQPGGIGALLYMNLTNPVFQDLRVRQAFNLAIDKATLAKVITLGYGEPLFSPVRPATIGYWAGAKDIGYGFDLAKAKSLMKDAGYTLDGTVLKKDGAALEITIKTFNTYAKDAEIIQQQLQALGVTAKIQQLEIGALSTDLLDGKYDVSVYSWSWDDTTLLFGLFHSSTIGASNYSQLKDADFDKMLIKVFMSPSRTAFETASADAQKYLIEKAYVAPLYAPKFFNAVSSRVKDISMTQNGVFYFFDAYIQAK